MRLLMYRDGTGLHLGALRGDEVVALAAASKDGGIALPDTLLELIDLSDAGMAVARSLLDRETGQFAKTLDAVKVLAPLDPPRENVLAVGRNYRDHAEEMARAHQGEVMQPTIFTKAQTSINGPFDDIAVSEDITKQLDWEAELGVIVGRRGRNIPPGDSLDYVFGYTVVNDVSARDIQYGWGGQFFKGKSLDGSCPIGPWIVTADEIPNPQSLRVTCRVNGETKQDANTRDMIFPVGELLSRLSLGMTLLPGNLIATGTPVGTGFGSTPQQFLQPGDVLETEIEGIGIMRNRIVRG